MPGIALTHRPTESEMSLMRLRLLTLLALLPFGSATLDTPYLKRLLAVMI